MFAVSLSSFLQADSILILMPSLHLGRAHALLGDWDAALAALEKVLIYFAFVALQCVS